MMFYEKVYEICKKIPEGKVSSYKEVARALNSKAYRAVGQALSCNPYSDVSCYRIVSSSGKLTGFYGEKNKKALDKKAKLLRKEGIKVENNKVVDFEKVLFRLK